MEGQPGCVESDPIHRSNAQQFLFLRLGTPPWTRPATGATTHEPDQFQDALAGEFGDVRTTDP